MIFYSGILSHGFPCSAYGDEVDRIQRSQLKVSEKRELLKGKKSALYFGTSLCNWLRARLECVPDEIDDTVTTTEEAYVEVVPSKYPLGHCKCMHALGKGAVWIESANPKYSKCYIPANSGHYSECEHDIPIPYGWIDEIYRTRKNVGPASSMCVPVSCVDTQIYAPYMKSNCLEGFCVLTEFRMPDWIQLHWSEM